MRMRLAFIIIPALILLAALAGGSLLLLRLFSLSVLVLLLSYLWVRFGILDIDAQARISPGDYQAGEFIDEEITIFNRSRLPKLLIEVQENSNLPAYHNMLALSLSPQSSGSWKARAYCRRRGQYHLGSFTATVSDPFGFFSLCRNLGQPQQVLIYPAIVELPFLRPASYHEAQYGPSRWLVGEVSPNAARVREYVSGDSLNHIHWYSTAKTGKLMVKVFDTERSSHSRQNMWVAADMHQGYQMGEGDESTEEYCITIAASLIKKYINDKRGVGLIAEGDRSYLFPPETGDQHLWRMFEALALLKATGETPVDQLIASEIKRFGANSTLVVITPNTGEQLKATLSNAISRGIAVIAILLDPASFGGTVTALNTAHRLSMGGIQAYVVRRGRDWQHLDGKAIPLYENRER